MYHVVDASTAEKLAEAKGDLSLRSLATKLDYPVSAIGMLSGVLNRRAGDVSLRRENELRARLTRLGYDLPPIMLSKRVAIGGLLPETRAAHEMRRRAAGLTWDEYLRGLL